MKLYIVSYQVGGYAREDASQTRISGVFTEDKLELAKKLKNARQFSTIHECELNEVQPGFKGFLKEIYGMKDEDFE